MRRFTPGERSGMDTGSEAPGSVSVSTPCRPAANCRGVRAIISAVIRPIAIAYMLFSAVIWVIGLPAALIRDESGALSPPWGPAPLVAVGAAVVVVGAALVYGSGRHLSERGVPLFGVRPGPVLVTDGPYGHLRNPQDLGATLMSLGPPIAVDVTALWLVPVLALVYFAAGFEPLENRHLLEAFEDDFEEYRAAVGAWVPRRD
jgi:protein-S-isoprenylcysteine O-methyltransferase Ste14